MAGLHFSIKENVMKKILALTLLTFSSASFAISVVPVSWVDWQSVPNSSSATGQLVANGSTVNVSYTGTSPHAFVQTSGGTDYWTGAAYTNGVVSNAPDSSDVVALNTGGTVTLNFSQTILNPFIAMNSWNGNVVNFSSPITIDSYGPGYWGVGSPISVTSTGFTGSGEFHGIIRLLGNFDSFSFTHTSENWHGFTVGVEGLATPNAVPLPAAAFMFAPALLGFMGLRRKAKKTVV